MIRMRDSKTGQFLQGESGNPKGRQEGCRNKLTEAFYVDLHEAWKAKGASAIDKMIEERPGDFVRVVASQMPKEMTIKTPLVDLSDDEIADLIQVVRHLTAQLPGSPTDPGAETETRH